MSKRTKFILALIPPLILIPLAGVLFLSRAHAIDLITNPLDERSAIDRSPADYGLPYEEVWVTSEDDTDLVGWFVPPQNGAVIMAQHGYKGNRTEMLEEAAMLHKHGYGVLFTTVRAHDLSGGELITFGYYEMRDLEAWFQYLLSQPEVDPEKVGILGNSMGGSMAIQYAAQNEQIKAVVAHSAFSSLDDTVSTSVEAFTGLPSFPFGPLIVFWAELELGEDSSVIDATQWIGQLSPRPVLLLHGGKDAAIDKDSAERLFQAAGEPKELWYEPGLGHAELDTAMPEKFERRIIEFFDQYLLGE
jgi:dipeptidyl aminopeptidase/acylaminoacyl peptidase